MATMKDVAERSGVSVTTVSHIINNTRPVSSSLRRRVMAAIDELDYRPYGLARSLRLRQTRTVGVLIPDNTNPYFAEIARFLEDRCFDAGYNVIICNTEQQPEKELIYLDLLTEKAVDGVVFVSTGDDAAAIEALMRRRTSCVLVDRDIPGLDLDRVTSDNRGGAYLATRYLIDLGHRDIACIAGPRGIASTEARLEGYRAALQERSLTPRVVHGDFQVESGRRAYQDLRSSGSYPTAVFASNDLMALGVLHAASHDGLSIPRDLSVIGFDDIQLAAYAVPALTTVRQPKAEIAQEAVELLLRRIPEAEPPGDAPARRVLAPELVVRDSAAPPTHKKGTA